MFCKLCLYVFECVRHIRAFARKSQPLSLKGTPFLLQHRLHLLELAHLKLEPLERELDNLCECCAYRLRLSVSESLHGLRRRFEWEVCCEPDFAVRYRRS